jgi:hypothetical protein
VFVVPCLTGIFLKKKTKLSKVYGLVNKAIKEFVITHHGDKVWEEIYKDLELPETHFLSMESNPDEVTFRIMNKVCQQLVIRR